MVSDAPDDISAPDAADEDRTFLVVDDEPDILDSIERLFRREYRVLTAQRAARGLELVESNTVQVVMADQRMPEMTGIDFLAKLRETHPHIVRVLLTGYSDIDHVIHAINEGHVYRYISKPWKPSELKLFVGQAFEYYESRRERERLLEQLHRLDDRLDRRDDTPSGSSAGRNDLDRMKDVFMEVVSHELNTPVAATVGYTELLRRELGDNLPETVERALSGIESSTVRLERITSRIFKMFSEDGPASTLNLEPLDLEEFVAGLRDRLSPFLDERDQSLDVVFDDAPTLVADRAKLRDVFLNLLMNAVKFSRNGQTIDLTVREDDRGDQLTFIVEDRGVGIDEKDRARIFDAFFSTFDSRHHSSGDYRFEKRGIGLGLSVARKFTEMHGGEIQVESESGEGSRFTVGLPLRPEPDDSDVGSDSRAELPDETSWPPEGEFDDSTSEPT